MSNQHVNPTRASNRNTSPFIDGDILARQLLICRDPITWYIYWRIASFHRNGRECYESPKAMISRLGISWSSFQRAVKRGTDARLFVHNGKTRSNCDRSWQLVMPPSTLTDLDADMNNSRPITAPLTPNQLTLSRESTHPAKGSPLVQNRVTGQSSLGEPYSEVIKRKKIERSVCSVVPTHTILVSNNTNSRQRDDETNQSSDGISGDQSDVISGDQSEGISGDQSHVISGDQSHVISGGQSHGIADRITALPPDVAPGVNSADPADPVDPAKSVDPADPVKPADPIQAALAVYRRVACAALSACKFRPSLWPSGSRDIDELSKVAADMPRDVAGGLAEAVGRLAPAWCSDVASHSASTGTDPRDAMATSLFCRWLAAKLKSEQQAKSAKAMAEEARIAAMTGNKRDTIGESMKSYFAAGLTPAAAFKSCRWWGVVLTAKFLAVHGDPDEAIEIIKAALTNPYYSRDLADIFASTIKYESGTSGMPLSDWRVSLASFVAKAGKLETFLIQGSEKGWCDNFIAGLAAIERAP